MAYLREHIATVLITKLKVFGKMQIQTGDGPKNPQQKLAETM